jgi:flavodoxin
MHLNRRSLLAAGLIGTASLSAARAIGQGTTRSRVLTACFSRTGNTETVAEFIRQMVGGDSFDISPSDPYPQDYGATVAQARKERASDFRPSLIQRNDGIASYDTVMLGYPIWAMTLPPVIRTFLDEHDLSGKTIVPFCTHKRYGRGDSMSLIQTMVPGARLLEGFDVEGIHAQASRPAVERWLRRAGLLRA